MKRKFLVLLCFVLILALAFSSCKPSEQKPNQPDEEQSGNQGGNGGGEGNDDCEHTYSDKWSTNSTKHWHAANCEHAELKSDLADHSDADENGKCDVCDYEVGHEHTYSDTWTNNDTHHWKNATCSHTDEKGELGTHADTNSDGACDSCSIHMHVLDLNGFCTVCQQQIIETDVTDLSVIIPLLVANSGKIIGGTIEYENICISVEEDYKITSNRDITYILGNSAAYYKVDSNAVSTDSATQSSESTESWYEIYDGNKIFGVYQVTEGGQTSDFRFDAPSANKLSGYYYSVSTLTSAYGAENLLSNLYGLYLSDAACNENYEYNDGVYKLTFGYVYVNSATAAGEEDHVDYFELEVSFTATDDGVLDSLNVLCNCYTNSSSSDLDHDFNYDSATGEVTLRDTAVADTYSFVIAQTIGERTYVSEHPRSDFIPEDFDIFLDSGCTEEIGDTVDVTAGKVFNLYVGNVTPTGTSISYIADSFSVSCESADVIALSNPISGTMTFNVKVAGTYTIVVTAADIVKEITVVATSAGSSGTDPAPSSGIKVEITGENTYSWDTEVSFTPTVAGDYTFTLPAGLGAADDTQEPYIDPLDPQKPEDKNGGTFTVSIAAGETYTFYVTSATPFNGYITYTAADYTGGTGSEVQFEEEPLKIGYNDIGEENVILSYTVTSNGKLTLSIGAAIMDVVEISYAVNGGQSVPVALSSVVTVELVSGDTIAITVVAKGYSTITATWEGDGAAEELKITEGTYIGTDDQGGAYLAVIVGATTVTFEYDHPMFGTATVVATYEIVNGEVLLYDENGDRLHPLSGTLVIDTEGNPVSASYDDKEYTLAVSGTSGGGNNENTDPVADIVGEYEMDGYDVYIYFDTWDNVYYFNAYNNFGDVYYNVSATEENDGSYTVSLSLDDESLDTFGFLGESFSAFITDGEVSLTGPAYEIPVFDYPDFTVGNNTVTYTEQDVSDQTEFSFDFIVEESGYYKISLDEMLAAMILTPALDLVGEGAAVLAPGKYIVKISISGWDFTAGEYSVDIAFTDGADMTAADIFASLSSYNELPEYYAFISQGENDEGQLTGVYYLCINSFDWMKETYYVMNVKDLSNGVMTVELVLDTDRSATDDFGLAGSTFTISVQNGLVVNFPALPNT